MTVKVFIFMFCTIAKPISTGLIAVYDQDFTSCDYKSTLFLESRDLICKLTMWLCTKL